MVCPKDCTEWNKPWDEKRKNERACAWETGQTSFTFWELFLNSLFPIQKHWHVQTLPMVICPLYSVPTDKHPRCDFYVKIAEKFTIFNVKIADQKLWALWMAHTDGRRERSAPGGASLPRFTFGVLVSMPWFMSIFYSPFRGHTPLIYLNKRKGLDLACHFWIKTHFLPVMVIYIV